MYCRWTRESVGVDVFAVELPGRWGRLREAPFVSLADLIDELVPLLAESLPDDFALFGYSLGGLVAFEAARALRKRGRLARHLFVAACGAPDQPSRQQLHLLSDAALLDAVSERYAPLPIVVLRDPELRELTTRVIRADLQVLETYRHHPEPPLACPITAFVGDSDPVVGSSLSAWQAQTAASFDARVFAGDHFFINQHQLAVIDVVSKTLRPS